MPGPLEVVWELRIRASSDAQLVATQQAIANLPNVKEVTYLRGEWLPRDPRSFSTPSCPEHGDHCSGTSCCCADKHPGGKVEANQ